jgi:spore coat protein U-like protein
MDFGKRHLWALAIGWAVLGSAPAFADTYSLSVSATVQGVCKFTQAAGQTLTFANNVTGGIDPSLATNATANATVTYKCTNGTAPSAFTGTGTHDLAGNKRVVNGVNAMVYTVSLTGGGAGDGFGPGSTNKTLTVAGTIDPTQFQGAPAGTYTDTLTLTIAP